MGWAASALGCASAMRAYVAFCSVVLILLGACKFVVPTFNIVNTVVLGDTSNVSPSAERANSAHGVVHVATPKMLPF